MRQGWSYNFLGEISSINYGYTAKASFEADGPKFLRITDIQNGNVNWATVPSCSISEEDYDKHRLFENDIVFARTGATTGKSYLIGQTEDAVAASYLIRLRLECEDVLPAFVTWYFQTTNYWNAVTSGITGSTQGGFNASKLKNLTIPLPPLPEQKRIVAILDEAFQGIDRAVANTEKNLANARELTNSVLETAICGNQTTLWRKNNPVSESAAESVARVFNGCRSKKVRGSNPRSAEPANANIFSSLPVDWTLASVEQICTHIVDCLHKTPKWTQSGEICLRTTNFKPGHLDLSSVKYVSKGTYMDRISRLEPKASDVLYSREGGILGIACMFPDGLKACLGQRMMVFRLDQSILIPEYFMAVLNSRAILSEVERLTGGAAAPHLNISDIRKFPIPIPPLSEQAIIVSLIGNLWGKFNRVENCFRVKANALAGLKQSILHKAFAGELTADRVRAEPVLAEAGA